MGRLAKAFALNREALDVSRLFEVLAVPAVPVVVLIVLDEENVPAQRHVRGVTYALYCAGVAAAVLIGIDLSHPHDPGDEGRRVLFTVLGIAIAVVVMLIANLIQKRNAPPTTPT